MSEFINPDTQPVAEQPKEIDAKFVYSVRYPNGQSSQVGEVLSYEVTNPNYEGDFAFLNLEDAIIYGFPSPKPVYIIKIDSGRAVIPHPETAPGTVYVANGSHVEAQRVPTEFIDEFIESVSEKREVEDSFTQKVIESTFGETNS